MISSSTFWLLIVFISLLILTLIYCIQLVRRFSKNFMKLKTMMRTKEAYYKNEINCMRQQLQDDSN